MTEVQKIIKVLASAFAIFLIVVIFSGIIYGLRTIYYIFEGKSERTDNQLNNELNDVNRVEIDLERTNLFIKIGDNFSYETNNEKLTFNVENEKLFIKEKDNNWFLDNDDYELIIYIPNDKNFLEFNIETGAGIVDIENVISSNADFDFGAGKVKIDNLIIYSSVDIDGGAGEIEILDSKLNNLELEMGVGKLYLKSKLIGKNEMSLGVGTSEIDLAGDNKDYKIRVNKGLGEFLINGENMSDKSVYGEGETLIDIEAGVGKVILNFE